MSPSRPLLPSHYLALGLTLFGASFAIWLPRPGGLVIGGPCLLAGLFLIQRHLKGVMPENQEALSKLESKLQELRSQLRGEDQLRGSILHHLGEGVVLIGPDRRIRLFNPGAQQLLTGSSRLTENGNLPELFREPESLRQVDAAFEGGEAEWTLKREPRVLRVRALAFPFQGEGDGLLITLDDITRQEALETTRQKFLSNASHELRTPVTGIRVAAENLLDGEQVKPEGISNLKSILRSVDRMTLLLDDISELSLIETGALRLDPEQMSIEGFALQIWEDQTPQARPRGIDLHLTVDDSALGQSFHADPHRMSQLLGNLVGNAIKFSPEGNSVNLRVHLAGNQVIWEVLDHGPGISAVEQQRIFERFYRARATRGVPVTGLGLAIVKHLAHLMGGEVGVRSEVGRGSIFTLKVPQS